MDKRLYEGLEFGFLAFPGPSGLVLASVPVAARVRKTCPCCTGGLALSSAPVLSSVGSSCGLVFTQKLMSRPGVGAESPHCDRIPGDVEGAGL